MVFPLRAHKIVGTDIFHAAALLYVAGFGHIVAGNVDMRVVGWLLIGSIPGVLIGSHYSVRIPEAYLRLALADVLAISGLKLVQVPNIYLAIAIGASVVGVVLVVSSRATRAPPAGRKGKKLLVTASESPAPRAGEQPPPAGRGPRPTGRDAELVESWRPGVDHGRVPVGIGPALKTLHFGKYFTRRPPAAAV